MDPWMVVLRIVHIGFGVFWVGTGIFFTFIFMPRLRAEGAAVQASIWRIIMSAEIVFPVSALLVIGSGVAIALTVKWGVLDTWFVSAWGYAILIGFIATLIGVVVSIRREGLARRTTQLAKSLEGREPSPEEASEMESLHAQMTAGSVAELIPLLIAVGAMAAARWL